MLCPFVRFNIRQQATSIDVNCQSFARLQPCASLYVKLIPRLAPRKTYGFCNEIVGPPAAMQNGNLAMPWSYGERLQNGRRKTPLCLRSLGFSRRTVWLPAKLPGATTGFFESAVADSTVSSVISCPKL